MGGLQKGNKANPTLVMAQLEFSEAELGKMYLQDYLLQKAF